MLHIKCPIQRRPDWDKVLHGWGNYTRYLEIGDDLYAVRQVDRFDNGYCLRYDRSRWEDEFCMLAGMKYSEKWIEWWGPATEMSAEEFENVWRLAVDAPNHLEQITSFANNTREPWIDPRHNSGK